ncbi:MAG: B12-binding domain-containing radical SAM protein [Candidatus Omnitrophica bacterium]|nr:B12-binding domain-containing radical SAM protein [Candidatus Omnitrophota bacterium]
MSKVILVNCPPWGVVMPPLGIAYLSAYLKLKGVPVDIFDLNLDLYEQADSAQQLFWQLDEINRIKPCDIAENIFKAFGNRIDEFIQSLSGYTIIGFSTNNLISAIFAGFLAKKIKAKYKDKTIILGGPGIYHSWDRKTVAKENIDFFIIGEGEEALLKFLNEFEINRSPDYLCSKVPGLLYAQESSNVVYLPWQPVKDLNSLAFPTFEEFDLSKYNSNSKYHPLPMLISRGCINQCSYCIDWYICSGFRMRRPKLIIEEMKYLKQKYNISHIEFNDLLCNGNLYGLHKLCQQMQQENLNLTWISYAAIRKNMTQELLNDMKKAGCNSLCYGIESGSDAVLGKMNKHYNSADAKQVIEKTFKAEIQVSLNIIVGFPGETEADFKQTIDFLKSNSKYISQVTNVSSFVLMPGSDVGIYPQRFGVKFLDPLDPGKWTDANWLTQAERNQRVGRICDLLKELKIKNLIVNYQDKNAKVCNIKNEIPQQITDKSDGIIDLSDLKSRGFKRRNKILKFAVLGILLIASIIIDFYLNVLKKLRGSIIFPGN